MRYVSNHYSSMWHFSLPILLFLVIWLLIISCAIIITIINDDCDVYIWPGTLLFSRVLSLLSRNASARDLASQAAAAQESTLHTTKRIVQASDGDEFVVVCHRCFVDCCLLYNSSEVVAVVQLLMRLLLIHIVALIFPWIFLEKVEEFDDNIAVEGEHHHHDHHGSNRNKTNTSNNNHNVENKPLRGPRMFRSYNAITNTNPYEVARYLIIIVIVLLLLIPLHMKLRCWYSVLLQ